MADENTRIERAEKDIERLTDHDEKHFASAATAATTTAETIIYVKQIFEKLDELKIAVNKDIERSTVTEAIVVDLKVTTNTLAKDLAAVSAKVTAIEQLPVETARVTAANAKKMKFMILQWLLGSGVALLFGIYKFIIWLDKVLNK